MGNKILCKTFRGLEGYGVLRHFQQYFSYILWWSVLLVEETGGPRDNHRPAASH